MKGFLRVVLCAAMLGLFTAGCGGCGGGETPPTGSTADPTGRVKELVLQLKEKRPEMRAGAAIMLGQFGADAKEALPELENLSKKERNKKVKEKVDEAIQKIKGA